MYDRFTTSRLIDTWLAEDVGHGDLTSQLMIEPGERGAFHMNARETLTVAGIEVAAEVFRRYEPRLAIEPRVQDGASLQPGAVMMTLSGPARGILTAERTALNILQRLCGIATETAKYAALIAHTRARLLDTRKTTPGLRMLEKHAVSCGGGLNHRLGLDNGVIIKDNHIAVCGSITLAVQRARRHLPLLTKIEVECDRLDQVEEALAAGTDTILLDNMGLADLRTAVRMAAGRVPLEASGGVRAETIAAIAETGVDFVSTSRITQSAAAVDIGLDEAA
jgi:nicotinate-nucleotide pyrophosphorylase (carboxylating)